MRNLKAGLHTVTVCGAGAGGRMLVRTVKRMMISPTCERPPHTEFVTHDIGTDFWRRYLYHTFNTYSFFNYRARPSIRYPADFEIHRDIEEYGFAVGGEARIPEQSASWGSPEALERTLAGYDSWKDGYGLLVDESSPYAARQNMYSMAETCWKRPSTGISWNGNPGSMTFPAWTACFPSAGKTACI